MTNFVLKFRGLVAYILLGLYIYLLWNICAYVIKDFVDVPFSEGETALQVLALIGGLVSTLVVARLAITLPGEMPAVPKAMRTESIPVQNATTVLTILYLSIWLVAGVVTLVIALKYGINSIESIDGKEVEIRTRYVTTIRDIGLAWLGIAIAACTAYFGLDPSQGSDSAPTANSG